MESIGGLLAQTRVAAGLSQAQLARRSGISRTVINVYESGTRMPGADALGRLVEACGGRLAVARPLQLDLDRNAEVLAQVLELADHLPQRRRSENLGLPALARP